MDGLARTAPIPGEGIAFTHWALANDTAALVSAVVALLSAATIFGVNWRRGRVSAKLLLVGELFYLAYIAYLFVR